MIVKKDDGKVIVPTLNSLSTGQLALFNLFATIVRYADTNDINKSIRLEEITGIVLIDEIELHLHSIMQKEILPKLFKNCFPKFQIYNNYTCTIICAGDGTGIWKRCI